MRLHKRGAVESIKYGVSAAKDLVLLDPLKTKMVTCLAMRRTSLTDGENISKIFQTQPLSIYEERGVHFWGRRNHHCNRSLTSFQKITPVIKLKAGKSVGCEEIRPEVLKALAIKARRSSLTDSSVSGGLVLWKGTERLTNWCDYPHMQEGKQVRIH